MILSKSFATWQTKPVSSSQLEEVMETETYKNAKVILERFDPESKSNAVRLRLRLRLRLSARWHNLSLYYRVFVKYFLLITLIVFP